MKFVLLLFILATTIASAQPFLPECGGFRAQVRNLADADTSLINFWPLYGSIRDLSSLPLLSTTDTTSRQSVEQQVYEFLAELYAYQTQSNGDIYLLLRSVNSEDAMLAAIPDPDCPEVRATSYWPMYQVSRAWLMNTIGLDVSNTTLTYLDSPWWVRITGVPFINQPSVLPGQAINNLEIHPILELHYGAIDTAVDEGASLPLKMDLSDRE